MQEDASYYSYGVFDSAKEYVASYYWSEGSYKCKYIWTDKPQECSVREFVNEACRLGILAQQ